MIKSRNRLRRPDFLYAALDKSAYAAFFTESRMRLIDSDQAPQEIRGTGQTDQQYFHSSPAQVQRRSIKRPSGRGKSASHEIDWSSCELRLRL
jgi:hypothetical protein